jgi:phage shock protein E
MKTPALLLFLVVSTVTSASADSAAPAPTSNPLIDYSGFQKVVDETHTQWASRLLSEDQFIKMMQEQGVIVLDARTADRYAERHIKGAINLPFTEFTAISLAGVLPSKQTKVLIYCNNNFVGDQQAFASKMPTASLNLSSYTSLVSYGYTNVYQLAPLLNVATTKIPFEGTEESAQAALKLEITPANAKAINENLEAERCD